MPCFSKLIAASTLAALAAAVPVPQAVPTKQGFTLNQSVAKPFQPGPVQVQKAYHKFGKAVPADLAKAAAGEGSATTTPEQYDVEYLTPVTIGGQTLNLDFDTGSADLWVFSTELPRSQQSGHSVYNPSKSSTAQQLQGASWSITYGDGSSASGNVYTDTVDVGGLTVTKQAVELASKISGQFQQDQDNDGLLGLAFSSINTVTPNQQTTFFDTATKEGALSQNVFTADLKKGAPGTYDFGFIDDSKHTGDITYTAVDNSKGFWEFTGTGYGVGAGNFQQTSIDAIADTGTTAILIDDSVVSDYYGQVSGAQYDQSQGGYTFDCSADLPDFIVGIEGAQFTVPGSYVNLAPVTDGSSTCFGGIQSNQGLGMSIYGDVFLKAIFAVFDGDNTRFGVANKSL